jgi:hypothetical protein
VGVFLLRHWRRRPCPLQRWVLVRQRWHCPTALSNVIRVSTFLLFWVLWTNIVVRLCVCVWQCFNCHVSEIFCYFLRLRYFSIHNTVTGVLQFPRWVAEGQILAFCRTEMFFRQKIVLERNALLAIPLQQTDLHTFKHACTFHLEVFTVTKFIMVIYYCSDTMYKLE